MKQIPIKKYEKLSTIVDNSGSTILTKITDYKSGSVTFEVKNNGQKHLFKTLKQAQNHLKKAPQTSKKPDKVQEEQAYSPTQASLNF